MSGLVTGHHEALPARASESLLPSASCVAAPICSRYGLKASESPDAPSTALTPPPAEKPNTKTRSASKGSWDAL